MMIAIRRPLRTTSMQHFQRKDVNVPVLQDALQGKLNLLLRAFQSVLSDFA